MTQEEKQKLLVFLSNKGFSHNQSEEIISGLLSGVDFVPYAQKELVTLQMRQIKLGLMSKVDVSIYANSQYDWFQMEEIRLGLEAGIDVNIYAKPEIPFNKMRELRLGLEEGNNLSRFEALPSGILRQLRLANRTRVNIIPFIKDGYDADQLEEIRIALEKKLDFVKYINVDFRAIAIREIIYGIEDGVDVSVYAQICYDWRQMREIHLGQLHRLDITQYVNPLYEWTQMAEVRMGLEEGLDVSQYRSLMYTAGEMRRRRLKMLNLVDVNIDEGKGAIHKTGRLEVSVADNKMFAYVYVDSPNIHFAETEIRTALEESHIKKGIREDIVKRLEEGSYVEGEIIIAEGKKPVTGSDGYYQYMFNTQTGTRLLTEDKQIDYAGLKWFELVKNGQKIAEYHKAGEGIPGYNVIGEEIPARRGMEKNILQGKGFRVDPQNHIYTAMYDGKIILDDNRMDIVPVLSIEDVKPGMSPIFFEGMIHISGEICEGAVITAGDDIVLEKCFYAAKLVSRGYVVLKNGVHSDLECQIHCTKGLVSRYVENTVILSGGDIYTDYILNSNVSCDGMMHVRGDKGTIIGGQTFSAYGIKTDNLGNKAGISTRIQVGVKQELDTDIQGLRNEINKVNNDLKVLQSGLMRYMNTYTPEEREAMSEFKYIESAIFTEENMLSDLHLRLNELLKKDKELRQSRVDIKKKLYDNVYFFINEAKYMSLESKGVSLSAPNGKIKITKNFA